MRETASFILPASLLNISAYARRWWAKVTGCARCKWVYPGIIAVLYSSALSFITIRSAFISADISPHLFLKYRRRSSATWSLRLRAVCSFLPASPMRAVSCSSMNICTSSAFSIKSAPLSISLRMPFSPSVIFSASSTEIIPHAASIAACAFEPAISSLYILLSKDTDELKSSASLSRRPSVLPAHIFAINKFLIF